MTDSIEAKRQIPKKIDVYADWQKSHGIPIVTGIFLEDINAVEVKPWAWRGVNGAFVHLDGCGTANDAYVLEIPPGGKTAPLKHMYEEMIYVSQGNGATTVWQDNGAQKHTFEWGEGSLFAIPLNATYQHFNTSGKPARYFSVNNASFMINLFHNVDFIFNCDYRFLDRFNNESEDFFTKEGQVFGRFYMQTNFVPDVYKIGLYDYGERGKGSTNMKFALAGNVMAAHISEFPVGTYKKGHRHKAGAHVVVLNGVGYSTMWKQGEPMTDYHWKKNSVIVPPDQVFHQHFNRGAEPARYLALRWNSWQYKSLLKSDIDGASSTSIKKGGAQIEFEDEDPLVHRKFVRLVEESGAQCKMCDYFPACPKKAPIAAE